MNENNNINNEQNNSPDYQSQNKLPTINQLNTQPSFVQQPTEQTIASQPVPETSNQTPNNQQQNKKIIFIIIGIIVLIIIIAVVLFATSINKNNEPKEEQGNNESSLPSFEKQGDGYSLKDSNGKVLLENIKYYGDLYANEFCNGSIMVTSTDDKEGIINTKGKFIVEYGKYRHIDQIGCYYKVTNYNDEIKTKILKYDGSVFFKDADDPYLYKSSIECPVEFCFSKKAALLTTKGKYILYDSKGKLIKEYKEISGVEEPKVSSKRRDEDNDRYLASYYNNSTDIIDTNTSKIIFSIDGNYYIKDINSNNQNQFIIYKDEPDENKRHAIIFNNGKKSFETSTCLNTEFEKDTIRCLKKDRNFEYYSINGKKVNKPE